MCIQCAFMIEKYLLPRSQYSVWFQQQAPMYLSFQVSCTSRFCSLLEQKRAFQYLFDNSFFYLVITARDLKQVTSIYHWVVDFQLHKTRVNSGRDSNSFKNSFRSWKGLDEWILTQTQLTVSWLKKRMCQRYLFITNKFFNVPQTSLVVTGFPL